jgi:WD40 repeat protein
MKQFVLLLGFMLFLGCSPDGLKIKEDLGVNQERKVPKEAILKLDTQGHTARINDIIVTKSGDIISASADKTIRVWDSTTGKEKRKILRQIGAGTEGKIYAMTLSPNEEFLAIGGYLAGTRKSGERYAIIIYNYQTGKLHTILKSHINAVYDLAFSPDGAYLISGSADTTAKIWRTKDFRLSDTIRFHTNDVYAVKIIQKGKNYFAITAGYDNQIALYNMQSQKIEHHDRKGYQLHSLATSQKHIAVCGKGSEIQIYNHALQPIQIIHSETKPNGLAYSPNGEFLIAGSLSDFDYELINIYSVKETYQKHQSFQKHKNLTMAVAFLDNQRAISGGGDNNEIYIWDRASGRVTQKIEGVGEVVWSVGVEGEQLAWGNEAINHTQVKTHTGKLQKTFNLKTLAINEKRTVNNEQFKRIATTKGAYSLHHRAGGSYGMSDAVLELKQNGSVLSSITRDATNGYRHNCYGFYRDYIISGGMNGQLKIYNLQGQEIANLIGHTGEVLSIALDGDRLVSGSNDQTIRVWNLSKLETETSVPESTRTKVLAPMLNLFISKNNDWIIWTPEGFYNASKGAEKYIGYHINQGANKEAEFLPIERFKKQFYRPDLIRKAIDGEDVSAYAKGIDIDTLLTAGLPPKVEILTPSKEIDENSVEIDVKICEKDGGVENLRFYVDDVPIKYLSQTKAYSSKIKKFKECVIKTEVISVPHGKHTIGFDTTNKAGNIISNRSTIHVENTTPVKHKPNLHLLTLSIADYQDDRLDLSFPNNDAKELNATFHKIAKPIFGKVYAYALNDAEVRYEKVVQEVKQIAKNVGPNDVFVFYLSGHGKTDGGNGDYYFIPYACRSGADIRKDAISQNQLKRIMEHVPTSKSVILLDTCDSGSMANKRSIDDSSVKRFGGNVGRTIIAGATAKQDAIDGYKEHGIFTYVVLDAMNNEKLYDYRDKLTVSHIAIYLKDILPKLSKEHFGHEQQPVIYQHGDTTFDIGGLE